MSSGRGPRPSRAPGPGGFTLVELLVVMLIIGVMIGVAIISLGATGRDSQLERERDRLNALFTYVRERGAILTLEYGIRCGVHGYRFVYYDNRTMRWLPETVDDTLRVRRLPAGVQLELSIEGHPIVLDDKALTFDPRAALPPGGTVTTLAGSSTALSSSSGASTPFSNFASSGAGGASSGSSLGPSGSSFLSQSSDNTPQIMLLSNGDTNTFALKIEREGLNRSATLQSNPDGTIQVGDIVEPPP